MWLVEKGLRIQVTDGFVCTLLFLEEETDMVLLHDIGE